MTAWCVAVEIFCQKKRIGADGHEFASGDRAYHDLGKILMQQRFAAGDHHDRRPAFVDRREAIGKRQALVESILGVIDLPAACASEVTAKQRFERQDERKPLNARQALAHHIGADLRHLQKRYSQSMLLKIRRHPRSGRASQS